LLFVISVDIFMKNFFQTNATFRPKFVVTRLESPHDGYPTSINGVELETGCEVKFLMGTFLRKCMFAPSACLLTQPVTFLCSVVISWRRTYLLNDTPYMLLFIFYVI